MASEVDSASSGGDSGRDSCNEVGQRKGGEFDNINVVVRVRPLHGIKYTAAERNRDQSSLFPAAGQIQVTDPQSNEERLFTFNVVFEPEASQMEVFEYSGIKRLIDMALEGFACTVFAYGQTGSGKTFTLSGNLNETINQVNGSTDPGGGGNERKQTEKTVGLIQLSFAYLFEQIKVKRQMNVSYVVTASYLEVYNEQVLDLLNPSGRALLVRWNKHRGFYAENLFKVECEDAGDLQGVLEEGMKNRQFRSHQMNEHSSRSHTLLTIALHSRTIDPEDPQGYITRQGRICLVDLAGSEKTKRTKCSRETLVEANRINSSLLALGNCISSLASAKKRGGHIPYRDSTLTKLLADSLSGNGLTLMIACVSPSVADASETISTLRYAARAKKVRTNPVIRMDPRELLILSLRREVRLLRMENHYLRHQLNLGSGFLDNLTQAQNNAKSTRPQTGESQSSQLSNGTTTTVNGKVPKLKSDAGNPRNSSVSAKEPNFEQKLIAEQLSKLQLPKTEEAEPIPKKPDQMVVKYMQENEGLRSENAQLHLQSEQMLLDLEEMNRENERLKRKLSAIHTSGGGGGGQGGGVQSTTPTNATNQASLGRVLTERKTNDIPSTEERILRSILDENEEELDRLANSTIGAGMETDDLMTSKNGTFKIRRGSLFNGDGQEVNSAKRNPVESGRLPIPKSVAAANNSSNTRQQPSNNAHTGKRTTTIQNRPSDDKNFALELRGKSAISFSRMKRK